MKEKPQGSEYPQNQSTPRAGAQAGKDDSPQEDCRWINRGSEGGVGILSGILGREMCRERKKRGSAGSLGPLPLGTWSFIDIAGPCWVRAGQELSWSKEGSWKVWVTGQAHNNVAEEQGAVSLGIVMVSFSTLGSLRSVSLSASS